MLEGASSCLITPTLPEHTYVGIDEQSKALATSLKYHKTQKKMKEDDGLNIMNLVILSFSGLPFCFLPLFLSSCEMYPVGHSFIRCVTMTVQDL